MPPCIWTCERKATSDEDVLPIWLRRHLNLGVKGKRRFQRRNILVPGAPDPTHPVPERVMNAYYVKARKTVCVPCNTGWMSDIQKATKPIMTPLVDNHPTTLTPTGQAILGTWAGMTGVTAEYACGTDVEEQRRRAIYQNSRHEPGPNTLVYLTHIDPVEIPSTLGCTRMRTKQNHRPVVYCVIFTAGSLGFVIFQGALREPQRTRLHARSASLIPVWPIGTLENRVWPPRQSIDVRGMHRLAQEVLEGRASH